MRTCHAYRYTAAGSHAWSVAVSIGGHSCTRSGTLGVASRMRERLPRADGGPGDATEILERLAALTLH